jgi:aspartokinase
MAKEVIRMKIGGGRCMENSPVTNISIDFNIALITIDSLPNDIKIVPEILTAVANENINIDMISQMPPYNGFISLSFSLPSDQLGKALEALNRVRSRLGEFNISIDAENTKIQVYGKAMRNIPGVAARLFTVLAEEGVEIKLVTTSEVDISCLIYEKDADKALAALKAEYGLSPE